MDYEGKLKLVDASYEAFVNDDIETLITLYDPECEWHMSGWPGWPEKPVYRGREGLGEFVCIWVEPWDEWRAGIKELVDLPGDRVLVLGHQGGRGRASGVDVGLTDFAQVIEFRDGMILRVENYSDVEEGRRVAGLAE